MSQALSPLDTLQQMVDNIATEIKALRSTHKEDAALAITRLKIFDVAKDFHDILDDIEVDIVRAKAVLLRDLEEVRGKRPAIESPLPTIGEEAMRIRTTAGYRSLRRAATIGGGSQLPLVVGKEREKAQPRSREPVIQTESCNTAEWIESPSKEAISKAMDISKSQPKSTSPSSAKEAGNTAKPMGLAISTTTKISDAAPIAVGVQNEVSADANRKRALSIGVAGFSHQLKDQPEPQNYGSELPTLPRDLITNPQPLNDSSSSDKHTAQDQGGDRGNTGKEDGNMGLGNDMAEYDEILSKMFAVIESGGDGGFHGALFDLDDG